MNEIERKWILSEIPSEVLGSVSIPYERHFLFNQNGIEIRVQKKGGIYEFERKVEVSNLSRDIQKFEITEAEFNQQKKKAIASIERESYLIPGNPEISIKVYHGLYEGLIRAEVEFVSEKEAREFIPPEWFGREVTDEDIGKDKSLIQLSREEFLKYLN